MYSNSGLFSRRRPPPPKHARRWAWYAITLLTGVGVALYVRHVVTRLLQRADAAAAAAALRGRRGPRTAEERASDAEYADVGLDMDPHQELVGGDDEVGTEGGGDEATDGGAYYAPRRRREQQPKRHRGKHVGTGAEEWEGGEDADRAAYEAEHAGVEEREQRRLLVGRDDAPADAEAASDGAEGAPDGQAGTLAEVPPPEPPAERKQQQQQHHAAQAERRAVPAAQPAGEPAPPAAGGPPVKKALIFTMDSLADYVAHARAGGPAGEIIVRESLEWGLRQMGVEPVVAASDEEFHALAARPDDFALVFLDPWTFIDPGACGV